VIVRRFLFIPLVVVVLLAAVGCNEDELGEPPIRDERGVVTSGGELRPDQLQVGDCIGGELAAGSNVVNAIPCAEAPVAQVVGVGDDPSPAATPYPGAEGIANMALGICAPAFLTFIGVPYTTSLLEIVHLDPDEEGWLKGSRTFVCFARNRSGKPLPGSVQNANV
jgi:hypothetical protein